MTVSYELVETLLPKMHTLLTGDDVRAKCVRLSKLLVLVEMVKREGSSRTRFPCTK